MVTKGENRGCHFCAATRLLPHDASALFSDLGADRGQGSLAIRHCRPDASIVSFGPNLVMFERLRQWFGGDAGVRRWAAGSSPGFAPASTGCR